MRWLCCVVVGACGFTPGVLPGTGTGDAGPDSETLPEDAAVDAEIDSMTVQLGPKVRRIDIVDAKVTGTDHANFPVLVSLSAPWLRSMANAGDVARDDGFDIYFSSDQQGNTQLSHEVEVYDEAAGTLVAWVKVASLSASTAFYLHYGDDSITTSQQNVADVWSADYELVAHLHANALDSTGNVTSVSASTSGAMAGKIANGTSFDGAMDKIDYGSPGAVDDVFTGGGSAEAWIYADTFGGGGFARVFSKAGWLFALEGNRSSVYFSQGGTAANGLWDGAIDAIDTEAWHHVVLVYNKDSTANDPLIYVDGASIGVTRTAAPQGSITSDASSALFVGNRGTLDTGFDGILDEVRLASATRSAAWIATQFANQDAPGAFVTVSAPL